MVASVVPAVPSVSTMTAVSAMSAAVTTTFGGGNGRGKCGRDGNYAGCGNGNKCPA
jgi:hypothetical protein